MTIDPVTYCRKRLVLLQRQLNAATDEAIIDRLHLQANRLLAKLWRLTTNPQTRSE